jgi:hypothetical protein
MRQMVWGPLISKGNQLISRAISRAEAIRQSKGEMPFGEEGEVSPIRSRRAETGFGLRRKGPETHHFCGKCRFSGSAFWRRKAYAPCQEPFLVYK